MCWKRNFKKLISLFVSFFMLINLSIIVPITASAATINSNADGDWSSKSVLLHNTSEAQLMVRSGDIDNFGFGWNSSGTNFNPFSGEDTVVHGFPWSTPSDEPQGLDRIMVVSGYNYNSNYKTTGTNRDGYTEKTSRHENDVKSVNLNYTNELNSVSIRSAVLQMFIDDIQPGNAGGVSQGNVYYKVKINNEDIPELGKIINSLDQSGPRGRMVTFQIPDRYLYLVESGNLSIKIDDGGNGVTGDGYAIDFVKLLINFKEFSNTATISGYVRDEKGLAIAGATVSAGGVVTATSNSNGYYNLENVPAGQALITASKPGYLSDTIAKNVVNGYGYSNVNFNLKHIPKLATPTFEYSPQEPTRNNVIVNINYPTEATIKEYRIGEDGLWQTYNGEITLTENGVIEARGKAIYNNYENVSEVAQLEVNNIIKVNLEDLVEVNKTVSDNLNIPGEEEFRVSLKVKNKNFDTSEYVNRTNPSGSNNSYSDSTGQISGYVWYDSNGNGKIEWSNKHELRKSGVEVRLYNNENDYINNTYTNEDGYYSLSGLNTQKEYIIKVVPPEGYAFMEKGNGEGIGVEDRLSKVDPSTGRTDLIQPSAGYINAGLINGKFTGEDTQNYRFIIEDDVADEFSIIPNSFKVIVKGIDKSNTINPIQKGNNLTWEFNDLGEKGESFEVTYEIKRKNLKIQPGKYTTSKKAATLKYKHNLGEEIICFPQIEVTLNDSGDILKHGLFINNLIHEDINGKIVKGFSANFGVDFKVYDKNPDVRITLDESIKKAEFTLYRVNSSGSLAQIGDNIKIYQVKEETANGVTEILLSSSNTVDFTSVPINEKANGLKLRLQLPSSSTFDNHYILVYKIYQNANVGSMLINKVKVNNSEENVVGTEVIPLPILQ